MRMLLIHCFRVSADGNCLYNNVSIHLVGNENLNLVLRLLTSIELCEHCEHYQQVIQGIVNSTIFSNNLTATKQIFHFEYIDELNIIECLVNPI